MFTFKNTKFYNVYTEAYLLYKKYIVNLIFYIDIMFYMMSNELQKQR